MKKNSMSAAKPADITPENFKKAMRVMRQVYAHHGIKSKADAYQLANQGFAEKRFSAADVTSMQKVFDVVFDDNSFKTAQDILNGSEKGLKLAKDKRAAGTKGSAKATKPTKASARSLNREKFKTARAVMPEQTAQPPDAEVDMPPEQTSEMQPAEGVPA